MKALHAVLVALAVAVTLTTVAAAGPDAAKQRVAIEMKNDRFVLEPLQAGALKRDSGTNAVDIPTAVVAMRQGQEVEIYRPTFTLKGKRGTLTIRHQIDWVDTGGSQIGYGPQIGYGTWKVIGATGEYAGIAGGGRAAHAGLNHGNGTWYVRQEGFLTRP